MITVENIKLSQEREETIRAFFVDALNNPSPELTQDSDIGHEIRHFAENAQPLLSSFGEYLTNRIKASEHRWGRKYDPDLIINALSDYLKDKTGQGITMDDLFAENSDGTRPIEYWIAHPDDMPQLALYCEEEKEEWPTEKHWRQLGKNRLHGHDATEAKLPLYEVALNTIVEKRAFDATKGIAKFFKPETWAEEDKTILIEMHQSLRKTATQHRNTFNRIARRDYAEASSQINKLCHNYPILKDVFPKDSQAKQTAADALVDLNKMLKTLKSAVQSTTEIHDAYMHATLNIPAIFSSPLLTTFAPEELNKLHDQIETVSDDVNSFISGEFKSAKRELRIHDENLDRLEKIIGTDPSIGKKTGLNRRRAALNLPKIAYTS